MAFPLHDGSERWRSLHSYLSGLCVPARRTGHGCRVYRRSAWFFQCRQCLRQAVGTSVVASCRLSRHPHVDHHPRILRRGGWLVPAIPLRIDCRTADGRCRLRDSLFHRVLQRPAEALPVGSGFHLDHASCRRSRHRERYRARVEVSHARVAGAVGGDCSGFVHAPRRRSGRGVPAEARLLQALGQCLPRSARAGPV